MKRPLPILLFLLLLSIIGLFDPSEAFAQTGRKDSIYIIENPGNGPYMCCYQFIVLNRQQRGKKISRFSVRIVSGRASIVPAGAGSPFEWSVFVANDLRSVDWFANTGRAELDSGQSHSGFEICVRDTGVVRFVWETGTNDSTYSRDTLAFACLGKPCDEPLFTQVPSNDVCIFDIDLIGGVRETPINDFHMQIVTPDVHFVNDGTSREPTGWRRSRANDDTISYVTTTHQIGYKGFAEGFRFRVDARHDSTFQIEWWTTNFGTQICRDTVTLRCAHLARIDSVRQIRPSAASCCVDLRLANRHLPTSTINRFALKVLTPGVRISPLPTAPTGWTRGPLSTAGDSIAFTNTTGLAANDTAIFSSLCFDNSSATTDTIRYRWYTTSGSIPVAQGTLSTICVRPLTRCDSVSITVDSTVPSQQRCFRLTLRNRNSRGDQLDRFVVRLSNGGAARSVISASGANGWVVSSAAGDSIVFTGRLLSGGTTTFDICLSLQNPASTDPQRVTWTTSSGGRILCSDVITFNAIILRVCDLASAVETSSSQSIFCCFRATFLNRNKNQRPIDEIRLRLPDFNVIFTEAASTGGWTMSTGSFPSTDITYSGGSIAPGDSAGVFTFCIDARLISARPVSIPVYWQTFSGGQLVCDDTMRVICTGTVPGSCDSIVRISSTDLSPNSCEHTFRVRNTRDPDAPIQSVLIRRELGSGQLFEATSTGNWNSIVIKNDTAEFTQGVIAPSDSADFTVRVDEANGALRIEVVALGANGLACRDLFDVTCGTSGVHEADAALDHVEVVPNPFGSSTDIRYHLIRPGAVTVTIRDANGREVRTIDRGVEPVGDHSIRFDGDGLPSGVYYFAITSGNRTISGSMLLVR